MSLLDDRSWPWVFALGTLSLSLAVTGSTLNPPVEYELSIFAGPPWFVWPMVGVATITSIVLAFYVEGVRSRYAGFALSTATVVAIAALPLLRSYHYFGRFDALNHLGTVRSMLSGVSANTTIYPATHLLSAVIVRVTGLSPEVALLLVTPVFVLLFALGLYCIAIQGGASSLGRAAAGFVPLTMPFVISVRLPKFQPLPTVLALLMFPLLLYLLFNTLRARRRLTVCFLVLAASQIFYHPQHALVLALGILLGNLVVLLSPFAETRLRPRLSLVGFVGAILAGWLYLKPSFWGAVRNVLEAVGSDTGVVEGATPAGDSLSEVGGSVVGVAVTILGPKLLLIAGLLTLALCLFARLSDERSPSDEELYTIGFVLSAGLFIPPFAVGYARSQMFRYIGAGLIFVSILLIVYTSGRDLPNYRPGIRHAVAALLLLSAVTALPAAYKSPYVYQPTDHVPETEFEGYEFAFENRHESPLRTFGGNPSRYRRALYGRDWPEPADGTGTEAPPLQRYISNRTVDEAHGTVVLTAYAQAKYVRLYPELGFSEEHFRYLESGADIHKLYSNGGVTVYKGRERGDP